MPTAIKLF